MVGINTYQEDNRAYFDQRFRLEPKFIVSDCLELRMRIHGANGNRWGQAGNGADYEAWDDAAPNGTRDFEIARIYMVIKTRFGLFMVGSMQCGVYGLNGMGYSGGRFNDASGYAAVGPFDLETHAHRITWSNKWGGFNIILAYQKDIERDDGNIGVQTNNLNTVPPTAAAAAGFDDDKDEFLIVPGYTWKNGSATLLFSTSETGLTANRVTLVTTLPCGPPRLMATPAGESMRTTMLWTWT